MMGSRRLADSRSQETLSEDVLTKMHAGASLKPKYPVLTPDDLREVDGVIFGSPTRWARPPFAAGLAVTHAS
jgi:multimeric flavodoxin WrbA